MIDTVAFRIHDLEINKHLVKFLFKNGVAGIEKKRKVLEEGIDIQREMKFVNFTLNHATGKVYSSSYRLKMKSHNSDISFAIDKDRDFIHMELSLPKYFYGDNVHQLVNHESEKLYSTFRLKKFYDLAGAGWMVFKGALQNFMKREFGDIKIRPDLIEVVQLDFCFNFIFKSQSQLKAYLSFIRQIKKKYQKDENAHSAYGPSSVYFPSKICTFKIYHKGPELKAHPGRIKSKSYYKGVQELADRTLRFEASFRPVAFRELWLKRSPLKAYVLAYRRWMKEGKFKFRNVEYKPGSPGKDVILKKGKQLDKRWSFWFDLDEQSPENGNVVFDQQLFSECLRSFWHQSKQFMLTGVTRLNVTATKVEYYGSGEKQTESIKGLSATKIRFIEVFLQGRSWDELERQGIMSRRQMQRYKALFRKIGFGDMSTNRRSLTDLDHTYKAYFDNLRMVKQTGPLPFR